MKLAGADVKVAVSDGKLTGSELILGVATAKIAVVAVKLTLSGKRFALSS